MKKQIYIYPRSGSVKKNYVHGGSPYVSFLIQSLKPYFHILNEWKPTTVGILDMIRYLHKTDILLLNWIEDLPDKQGGMFQVILFYLILFLCAPFHIKVVWVMHNKLSHEKHHLYQKRRLFRILLRKADLIITHSSEGVKYAYNEYGIAEAKIRFIHHPMMKEPRPVAEAERKFDMLIWGKIVPYKGVDRFLKYLHAKNLQEKYRILLAGEVYPGEYLHEIEKYRSSGIQIENHFITDEELDRYVSVTRMILFIYNPESILSSGSLMDSLIYFKPILGPDSGAFKDLGREGIITTFTDYDELIQQADDILSGKLKANNQKQDEFMRENTWPAFAEKFSGWIHALDQNIRI